MKTKNFDFLTITSNSIDQHPIIKLKTLIKTEMAIQAVGTVAIGFFPFLVDLDSGLLEYYYLTYGLLVLTSAFFIMKMNLFQKAIPQQLENGVTIKELIEHYARLCTNFSNFIIPFVAIAVIFIRINFTYNGNLSESFSAIPREQWIIIGGLMVFICGTLAIGTYYWLKSTYNKIMSWNW